MKKKLIIFTGIILFGLFLFLEFYKAPLPENHGKLNLQLFTGDATDQPLIVGFGGGEGGNAWASDFWQPIRQQFIENGYAFLAVGYFGSKNTPGQLDRISLNAIYDSIKAVVNKNSSINSDKIILIGASKGAELALSLASRYNDIGGLVAIVPPHVTFPAITIMANTSSWSFNDEEIAFVPATFGTIMPAIKGNLFEAHRLMLEDSISTVKAAIKVEKINGPILLISAVNDEQWPSTQMSEHIIKRLKANNFEHDYKHLVINGGHSAPLDHFDTVIYFLNTHFHKKQNTR